MPQLVLGPHGSHHQPDEDQTGSRAARIRLFKQGLQVFIENPITGIGAGQFLNYDGDMMVERWRVTHNVWLQVAAELGIFGFCGVRVPRRARVHVLLCRAPALPFAGPTRQQSSRAATTLTPQEQKDHRHQRERHAGRRWSAGWSAPSSPSVAFNWTFYYVLALAVAGREIAQERLAPREAGEQRAVA